MPNVAAQGEGGYYPFHSYGGSVVVKVVVFHANVPLVMTQDPELVARLLMAPDEVDVKEVMAMNGYERVAEMEVAAESSVEALEKAFVMTQNIDESWCKSEGVTALVSDARSSMIGDVFLIDGKFYLVAMVGFCPIKPQL
jgi:hypothetical protein